MVKNNKKSILQDGIILWFAYHLFDVLRQVSLFQQIRNISKWCWNYRFKKKHPKATKEERKVAWIENRPFTSGFLFPEIWVLANILMAIIGCIIVGRTSCAVVRWIFLVYAFMRTFEVFVYQVNVLLFDPIKSGIKQYRIKSAARTVLLLICNIFEYILWFSVVYIFMYKTKTSNVDSLRIILESITTLANVASPDEFSDYEKGFEITLIAYIESVIGIFMNIVCLARFISLLPPVQSIDEN